MENSPELIRGAAVPPSRPRTAAFPFNFRWSAAAGTLVVREGAAGIDVGSPCRSLAA